MFLTNSLWTYKIKKKYLLMETCRIEDMGSSTAAESQLKSTSAGIFSIHLVLGLRTYTLT